MTTYQSLCIDDRYPQPFKKGYLGKGQLVLMFDGAHICAPNHSLLATDLSEINFNNDAPHWCRPSGTDAQAIIAS